MRLRDFLRKHHDGSCTGTPLSGTPNVHPVENNRERVEEIVNHDPVCTGFTERR
jgi:hypothetical protein